MYCKCSVAAASPGTRHETMHCQRAGHGFIRTHWGFVYRRANIIRLFPGLHTRGHEDVFRLLMRWVGGASSPRSMATNWCSATLLSINKDNAAKLRRDKDNLSPRSDPEVVPEVTQKYSEGFLRILSILEGFSRDSVGFCRVLTG